MEKAIFQIQKAEIKLKIVKEAYSKWLEEANLIIKKTTHPETKMERIRDIADEEKKYLEIISEAERELEMAKALYNHKFGTERERQAAACIIIFGGNKNGR